MLPAATARVSSKPPLSRIALAIVFAGAALRLGLAAVNPPGNAFDDHLEPIARWAETLRSPAPDDCWQCYQPPFYYCAAGVTLRLLAAGGAPSPVAWKGVQLLSAVASALALVCVAGLLARLPVAPSARHLALLVVALLPRDLYTSASIGNDAWLELFAAAAALGFVLSAEAPGSRSGIALLAIASVAAAWTKQSGIVVLALPAVAALDKRLGRAARLLLLLAVVVGVTDEAARTARTGIPLVSNQHFDYRARVEHQPPGRVDARTFLSFDLPDLMRWPTLSRATVGSFFTQIFARFWFDYEPRFFPPTSAARRLARSLYIVGALLLVPVLLGLGVLLRRGAPVERRLLLLPLGFLSAAILQTLRFPHFSSMKAVFVLPAVGVLALAGARGLELLARRRAGRAFAAGLAVGLVLVGGLHWGAAVASNRTAVAAPGASPVWPLPPLPGGP